MATGRQSHGRATRGASWRSLYWERAAACFVASAVLAGLAAFAVEGFGAWWASATSVATPSQEILELRLAASAPRLALGWVLLVAPFGIVAILAAFVTGRVGPPRSRRLRPDRLLAPHRYRPAVAFAAALGFVVLVRGVVAGAARGVVASARALETLYVEWGQFALLSLLGVLALGGAAEAGLAWRRALRVQGDREDAAARGGAA